MFRANTQVHAVALCRCRRGNRQNQRLAVIQFDHAVLFTRLAQRGRKQIHLRRTDKLRHKLIGRLVVQLQRRAHLLDVALIEHHNTVGKRHRLDLIVGDINNGDAQTFVQGRHLHAHLHAQGSVEV
ncbi:hypothetical protein SRABI106_03900 [Rahnella aquatilis]|nr:hypothetical protein SRABI106_03900 [Rahnella aquatilis]